MSYPYAPLAPKDRNGEVLHDLPFPKPALQVTAGNPAASSVISFSSNSTAIEVTAGNNPIAFKWGSASVIASGSTANFDHIIPQLTTRRFVIPQNTQGVPSIVGLNAQAGLYNTAAVIVASSVISGITEY